MRTTDKQIDDLVKQISDLTGLPNNRQTAKDNGFTTYLSYENAACYGGYRLIMIGVTTGGHNGALGMSSVEPRLKPSEFATLLNGIIYGLEFAKK